MTSDRDAELSLPRPDAGKEGEAIEAANCAIREIIARLPPYESLEFWTVLDAWDTPPPPEVLVHVLRAFHARGMAADVERACDELINRAYPIAAGIVRRTLLSRPQDHDDAIYEAIAAMWTHIVKGDPFWERNFVGAFHAVCISACRRYLAKKRSDIPFADMSSADDETPFEERLSDSGATAEQEHMLGQLVYERALAHLEPPLREIARLMAEGELTQRQIAARVGCTEKTIYNRLARIRDHLAGFFDEEAL